MNLSKLFVYLVISLTVTGQAGCTGGSHKNPEEERMKEDVAAMESQINVLEEKIKNSDNDRGNQIQLLEERDLIKSRLRRLQTKLGISDAPAAKGEH